VERAVVSVAHGDFDYYYDLARRHEPLIDCFVAYTRRVHDELRRRLPHRAEAIVNVPYGVRIPEARRAPAPGPLRLLYVGRFNKSKGVLDLAAIHRHVAARGVQVTWTLHGAGPDADALRRSWPPGSPVTWSGPAPMARVLALYGEHDVLVLPSRAEGLPVALLEAMAAGVVPVVSDLASGIPEVVAPGVTGFRPPAGDLAAFADAIAALAGDRDRLEHMSGAARRFVAERHDIRERAPAYQALYARCADLRRPRTRGIALGYGSRLDRPWLPNAAVYATRAARRWLEGRRA
jgi:glycosyltransferase involved in cell wall biosynthesis